MRNHEGGTKTPRARRKQPKEPSVLGHCLPGDVCTVRGKRICVTGMSSGQTLVRLVNESGGPWFLGDDEPITEWEGALWVS